MNTTPKIIKGISTSVLFDMREANHIYRNFNEEAYAAYMMERANEPLQLSKYFNSLKKAFSTKTHVMDVVVVSRNSPITARRALLTLKKHKITPSRIMFTNGQSPIPFLQAYDILQFHTTNEEDAAAAVKAGTLASFHDFDTEVVLPEISMASTIPLTIEEGIISQFNEAEKNLPEYKGKVQWHYVFDLDGVVFDQSGEKYFQQKGLDSYRKHEKRNSSRPMKKGPAFPLFERCHQINASYSATNKPIMVSIVTARGDAPAVRAIETLYSWGLDITGSAHFLNGTPKQPILEVISKQSAKQKIPCEFLDDQGKNISMGKAAGLISGQVPGFNLK